MADLPHLTPVEARILGCLIEKKELTPDVYPLTLNALQAAANQKTSREPVLALEPVEISRALSLLQEKSLARQVFASRVDRYEHLAGRLFSLTQPQSVLLALLLLRGPQTLNELQTRSERMAYFSSADDVKQELDLMVGRHPPLVKEIGRAPGQREDRFAHLLSGDVEAAAVQGAAAPAASAVSTLEVRLQELEEKVAELTSRLGALGG
jgi:uncharacterized protein